LPWDRLAGRLFTLQPSKTAEASASKSAARRIDLIVLIISERAADQLLGLGRARVSGIT
jgi:hypothetical protein